MSHNAFIRPLGVWNLNSILQSAEAAALDLAQFKAINGDDGGSWAPSIAITLGGAGVHLAGGATHQLTASSTLAVASGSTIHGLNGSIGTWSGAWTFDGNVFFDSAAVALVQSGGSFSFASGSSYAVGAGVTWQVDSRANFSKSLYLTDGGSAEASSLAFHTGSIIDLNGVSTLNIHSTASLVVLSGGLIGVASGGGLVLAAGSSNLVEAPLTLLSKGAIHQRFTVVGSAASIDVEDIDEVRLLHTSGGYTVAFTGTPVAGMKIRVGYCASIASGQSDITVTIGSLSFAFNSTGAGKVKYAEFTYDHISATAWVCSFFLANLRATEAQPVAGATTAHATGHQVIDITTRDNRGLRGGAAASASRRAPWPCSGARRAAA